MRIALLKIGALGDVLRTTCLLPALKRLDPDLDLTWITAASAVPLLQGNRLISRIVDYQAPVEESWRRIEYDRVISLDDDVDVCRLAGRLSSNRLSGSYEDADAKLRYTPDVEAWFGMGRLRRPEDGGLSAANDRKRANERDYGAILYDALNLPLPVEPPTLNIPEAERRGAIDWLHSKDLNGRRLVALNTGAGGRWRFKSWGLEDTARLASEIARRLDASVLILGGMAESGRNTEIVSLANSTAVVAAPCDLSLLSFAALIGETDVLVSSDSLAMHIGIALKRPVIAFFGPTSDSEINLFGRGEKITTGLPCRRCYLPDCDVRPHCMQSIGVEAMFDAVSRWLP